MANIFEKMVYPAPERSTFDLSHDVKSSYNIGNLVPVYCEEVLPGDNITLSCHSAVKFAPLVHPVMSRLKHYYHYYKIPNRVMWHGWKYYITGDKQDKYTVIPYFKNDELRGDFLSLDEGGIYDYLGVTITQDLSTPISAFPLLGYFWIIRDYYIDEFVSEKQYQFLTDVLDYIQSFPGGNLWLLKYNDVYPDATASHYIFVTNDLNDPDSCININKLYNRYWAKDYFTSALPFAQAGEPVTMPISLTGKAPVTSKAHKADNYYNVDNPTLQPTGTGTFTPGTSPHSTLNATNGKTSIDTSNWEVTLDNAEVKNETTIKMLREAFTMEIFLERLARVGKKFGDFIKGMFGVTVPDYTYDKAVYLGGDVTPIQISEVLQTSETDETALGERAGNAMAVQSSYIFSDFSYEHGFILGLTSILPESLYCQGVPRMFSHIDRFDFAFPQFAHLGEQEILTKELYLTENTVLNDSVFGYIPRYTEYKYRYNRLSGQFRSELQRWAIARLFGSAPNLNADFLATDYEDFKDIFAYYGTEQEHVDTVVMHTFFDVKASRLLPKNAIASGLYPQ